MYQSVRHYLRSFACLGTEPSCQYGGQRLSLLVSLLTIRAAWEAEGGERTSKHRPEVAPCHLPPRLALGPAHNPRLDLQICIEDCSLPGKIGCHKKVQKAGLLIVSEEVLGSALHRGATGNQGGCFVTAPCRRQQDRACFLLEAQELCPGDRILIFSSLEEELVNQRNQEFFLCSSVGKTAEVSRPVKWGEDLWREDSLLQDGKKKTIYT